MGHLSYRCRFVVNSAQSNGHSNTSLSEEQQAQLSTLPTNLTDLNKAISNLNTAVVTHHYQSGTSTTSSRCKFNSDLSFKYFFTAGSIATAKCNCQRKQMIWLLVQGDSCLASKA